MDAAQMLLWYTSIDGEHVNSALASLKRGSSGDTKGDSGGSDVDLLKRVKFSAVEQGEITRYLQEDDKKRALLSRLLQRAAVGQAFQAQLADDCAHDIVIARTRENKPFVSSIASGITTGTWNFNVSHHGRLACIAAHPTHLMGVDLVTLSTRSKSAKSAYEFINIFKDNLTESEMIRILSEENETSRYVFFFIFWSLKESYIKAIGLGLGFDLQKIEFTLHLSSSEPTALKGCAVATIHGKARRDWRFDFFSVDDDHVMSVARGPLRDAIPSFQKAAWPGSNPILNHEEMFRQGTLNAAKNGHPCKVLGNTDNDSSSSGSSREDSNAVVDKGCSSSSSVCMSDGKKSSEKEEEEVELWADLFGEHFRDDRLPPLVEISLPQLLHLIAPVKR